MQLPTQRSFCQLVTLIPTLAHTFPPFPSFASSSCNCGRSFLTRACNSPVPVIAVHFYLLLLQTPPSCTCSYYLWQAAYQCYNAPFARFFDFVPSMDAHVSTSGQSALAEVQSLVPPSVSRPPIVRSLPAHQMRDLTEAFKMFDLDGDGKISRGELGRVLRSLGETMTDEELGHMIRDVDANGDGEIDLEEFINLNVVVPVAGDRSGGGAGGVGTSGETPQRSVDGGHNGASGWGSATPLDETEALKSAFEVFDADKDGFISAGELFRVLASLGDEHISLDDCGYMISCVDLDGDQMVDFDEFQTLMSGNP